MGQTVLDFHSIYSTYALEFNTRKKTENLVMSKGMDRKLTIGVFFEWRRSFLGKIRTRCVFLFNFIFLKANK